MSTSVERITALNLAVAACKQMDPASVGGVEKHTDRLLNVAKEFEKYIVGDGDDGNTRPLETNDGPSKIETRVDPGQMQLEDQECARCGVKLKDHGTQYHEFEARKS